MSATTKPETFQKISAPTSKSNVAIAGEHTHVHIPKRAKSPLTKDRVRLSVVYRSTSIELLLADVKLDNLGLWVAIQRYWGNIDEIWVKGVPSAGCSVIPVKY